MYCCFLPFSLSSPCLRYYSLPCLSFSINKVFVGFNETGNHCCKKISSAITLRCQATYIQSASSNNALLITKSALCLSQSAFSNFAPHVISSLNGAENKINWVSDSQACTLGSKGFDWVRRRCFGVGRRSTHLRPLGGSREQGFDRNRKPRMKSTWVSSVRKQPTFWETTSGFTAKWRLRNERRPSILIRSG